MDQKPKTARRTRTYQSARASQAARAAKTAADANADRASRPRKNSSPSTAGKKNAAASAGRTDPSQAGRKSTGKKRSAQASASSRNTSSSGKKRSAQTSSAARNSASSGKKRSPQASSAARNTASSGKKRSPQTSSAARNSASSGKRRSSQAVSSGSRNGRSSEVRHANQTNHANHSKHSEHTANERRNRSVREHVPEARAHSAHTGSEPGILTSIQRGFLVAGKAIAFFAGEALRLLRGLFGTIAAFFLKLRGHVRDFLAPGVLIPGILKWAAFAALAVFLFQSFRKIPVSETPFDTMAKAVTEAAELDNTVQGDNQIIKRLYGLTPSDYNGALLYCPVTNMGAEELLLVRLADPSQEQTVMDAIARRLETQLSNFNGYGVDQTETLEKSISLSEGGYCLFYSGNGTQEVQSALKSAL